MTRFGGEMPHPEAVNQEPKRKSHKAEIALMAALAFLTGGAQVAKAGKLDDITRGAERIGGIADNARRTSNENLRIYGDITNENLRARGQILNDIMRAANEGKEIDARVVMEQIRFLQEEGRQSREMTSRAIDALVNLADVLRDNNGNVPPELMPRVLMAITQLAQGDRATSIASGRGKTGVATSAGGPGAGPENPPLDSKLESAFDKISGRNK